MPEIKQLNNVKLKHLLVERDPKNPDKLIYTRKLQDGNGPKSYGILVCKSMAMDTEFIEMAENIRQQMSSKKDISTIDIKSSKYNSNKLMTLCEICQDGTVAEDVHHINEQNTANSLGLINNDNDGIFHKNNKWNLVSLCKKCHQDVHSVPSLLKIDGYLQTSSGISLKYERANSESNSKSKSEYNSKYNTNTTTVNNIDNHNEIQDNSNPPPYQENIQLQKITHLNQIDNSLKNIIVNYKNENKTPKKYKLN